MPKVNEHGPGFALNLYCIVFIIFPSSEMEQKTLTIVKFLRCSKEQA